MKLIENWKDKNLKCHFCGETRSVKYEALTLYPISVWYESFPTSEVELQWKSDRRCDKFINRIVEKHKEIIREGYFWKSDGSCPSTIIFKLREKISG